MLEHICKREQPGNGVLAARMAERSGGVNSVSVQVEDECAIS
jgi:hypothetical protein